VEEKDRKEVQQIAAAAEQQPYLVTVSLDEAIRYWQVDAGQQEDGSARVVLRMTGYQSALCASEANLTGVTGLSHDVCQMLKQKGALL